MSPKLLNDQITHVRSRVARLSARGQRLLLRVAFMSVTMGVVAGMAVISRAKPLNLVSNLVVQEEGDTTVIRLHASARPMFSVFKLERPSRLTVDVANSQLQGIARLTDVDTWAVSQIATTQFRTDTAVISRMMINFRRSSHYTVRTEGRALVVTVTPHQPRRVPDERPTQATTDPMGQVKDPHDSQDDIEPQ